MKEQFDRDYYQRFYFNPRTAVTNRVEMNARGSLIAAMAAHLGLPVRSILDAGFPAQWDPKLGIHVT